MILIDWLIEWLVDFMIDWLIRERLTQIESKLAEVKAERAQEYIQPLEELQVLQCNAR